MSNDIRYLTPINIEIRKDKYCRFKKSGIKFIDYKDANFLLKLVNEQGKILPRRITGTSAKYQKESTKRLSVHVTSQSCHTLAICLSKLFVEHEIKLSWN